MAEQQAGTSYQYESDESVVEVEVDSPDPVEEDESISSDEHALMITNEIMQYVLSKDRKIYWMLNPCTTDEEEEPLPPSKTFVSTPSIYSISSLTDIRSAFTLYLNNSIIDTVVMNTNKHGRKIFGNDWTELTQDVLEAFIGLMLLGGIFQSHGEPMKDLWNKGTGRQIFRLAMSLKIFLQISRALNFESNNSAEGDQKDELAPIRGVWDQWMQLLPKFYNPGNDVTIGEQIIGFKGICPMKQFSSNKSSQCGIKVCTLCDSKTSYVLKVQICEGKLDEKLKKDERMQTVLRLTQGLKYRNVTCNKFFASYQLGQLLLRRKLTMLGLVTGYRPELPAMESNKELYSSDFYFTENTTLLHYVPRKNQPVFLLSTKHKKRQINDQEDKKPLIYADYENAKGAIERLERDVFLYSCKRETTSWTSTLFYHMIDISAHNAFILWTGLYPSWKGYRRRKRRMFLEELGKSLILPYMSARKNFPQTEDAMALLRHLQERSGYSTTTTTGSKTSKKKPKCKNCPKKCDTITNVQCASCKKFLCKKHTIYVCQDCKK